MPGEAIHSVWLHGSSGRMGRELQQALLDEAQDFRLVGGSAQRFEGPHLDQGKPVTVERLAHALARVELVIDFSGVEANATLLKAIGESKRQDLAVLVGTTGIGEAQRESWRKLASTNGLKVLFAPNTSVGILLLAKAALMMTGLCTAKNFDIEIVETHHRAKKDAPSGTAKYLAERVASASPELRIVNEREGARQKGDIGVHAVRGGGVIGEHEIRFIGDFEEIKLSHRAFSRALFARGALTLARWLIQRPAGFYVLTDVELDALAASNAKSI